jgi:hypothetical protein
MLHCSFAKDALPCSSESCYFLKIKVIVDGVFEATFRPFTYDTAKTAYFHAVEPTEKVEGGMITIIAKTEVDTSQEGAVQIEFRTSGDSSFAGATCEVYDGADLAPVDSRSMPGARPYTSLSSTCLTNTFILLLRPVMCALYQASTMSETTQSIPARLVQLKSLQLHLV